MSLRETLTPRSGRSSPAWLKAHLFDVAVLLFGTMAVLRFWWAYLGIQDTPLLVVTAIASITEFARHIVIARRRRQPPSAFFGGRRADLVTGILIGTGPWPIVPSLGPSVIWSSFGAPAWVQVAVLTGVLAFCTKRLIAAIMIDRSAQIHKAKIRQLISVPDIHVASMFILPSTATQ
jgi:hypothetical protein